MDRSSSNPLGKSAAEKLAQPKMMSNYQKERNAQEAKKREEEAANAAALRDFENEFGADDDDRYRRGSGSYRAPSGPRGYDGPGRYDARYDRRRSPERHVSGPPLSMKRKRQLEDQRERDAAFQESKDWQSQSSTKRPREDHREERQPNTPSIYVSELPPNMQSGQLKAILSRYVNVQSISLRAPTKDGSGRRSMVAVVFTTAATPASNIDNAIDKLQGAYAGYGHVMSLSRSVPVANLHPLLTGRGGNQPFGAAEVDDKPAVRPSAPHGSQNRFAPPEQYHNRQSMVKNIEVDLDQSLSLSTVRAIHIIVDELLSFPKDQAHRAMEMEALFMRLAEVQNDQNLKFLYDSRSVAGLYYRYCLWAPALYDTQKMPALRPFTDKQSLIFRRPSSKRLPFNGLGDLSEAIDDPDYASSEEEGDGQEQQALPHEMTDARTTLSPLLRARFAHLLGRLPTAKTMLRHGDVARVTNFAISHAATGIEQIIDMMILNVAKPFSLFSIASGNAPHSQHKGEGNDAEEDYDPDHPLPSIEEQAHTDTGFTREDSRPTDPSSAMHVGLLIISDVLSAIHTADGAKNAWRFRGLLEQGLREQKIFERLGQLDREYSWGKLTADNWRRRINALLDIWDSLLCFSNDVVAGFRATFNHEQADTAKKEVIESKVPAWRTAKPKGLPTGHIRVLDGGTIDAAEHAKAYAKSKELVSMEAMPSEVAPAIGEKSEPTIEPQIEQKPEQPAPVAPKKRLRAEDMFADEDW